MSKTKTTVRTVKEKNARKHEDESGMFIIFLFIISYNIYVFNFSTLVYQQLKVKNDTIKFKK